jgi:predicted nucleotidyltransferase
MIEYGRMEDDGDIINLMEKGEDSIIVAKMGRRKESMVNREISHKGGIIAKFLSMLSLPSADIKEIYLFGSRCRDDWRPDSDYDILIVLEKREQKIISKLYDAVTEILLDTGRIISLKIFTASEFNRLKAIPTPFMEQIIKEGIRLGSHD